MDYGNLKQAILSGKVTVKLEYLPAQSIVFSIMFHKKELAQAVIQAVTNEAVNIIDPLAEHRNDLLKAIESSVWEDVFTKDENNRIFTLDMQRKYLKTRNRNRNVYYGAKELSSQEIIKGQYEKLKQVAITFIFESNTTPEVSPLAEIQLMDVNTHEIYTDLLTLYEVNLNRIDKNSPIHQDLIILKYFLTIKTQDDLCEFVNSYDSHFARSLVIDYINAITDEATLIKIGGSKKFMSKVDFEKLTEALLEGIEKGIEKGTDNTIKIMQALKANTPISEIEETYQTSAHKIEEIRQAMTM